MFVTDGINIEIKNEWGCDVSNENVASFDLDNNHYVSVVYIYNGTARSMMKLSDIIDKKLKDVIHLKLKDIIFK